MLIVNTGSLADRLKQQDGSGDADIQGVESAQHWDTDMSRGGMAPLVGQSGSLRPHDDGSALPHVTGRNRDWSPATGRSVSECHALAGNGYTPQSCRRQ